MNMRCTRIDISLHYSCCVSYMRLDDGLINPNENVSSGWKLNIFPRFKITVSMYAVNWPRGNTVLLNSHQSEKWLLNKPTKYFRIPHVLSCIPKLQVGTNWPSYGETLACLWCILLVTLTLCEQLSGSFFIHQLTHKWIVLKTILKFTLKLTLKQLQHVSVQSHHHQGVHYLCLLKL
jgi:hypothetical protein